MSLCPVCGRAMCDHTPGQRDQTFEEMMRPLSEEELQAWKDEPDDSPKKIEVAKRHAHDPAEIPKAKSPRMKAAKRRVMKTKQD